MFCVNNVCVGQPCNQSSECPNREKCFDGKCLKSITYNISNNNSSSSNNTNNNETSSCRHHEECSNRNQTHVCSRRRLNFNIYFCLGRISPRAVASLPLYHALFGIKVLVRFNSISLLTALHEQNCCQRSSQLACSLPLPNLKPNGIIFGWLSVLFFPLQGTLAK